MVPGVGGSNPLGQPTGCTRVNTPRTGEMLVDAPVWPYSPASGALSHDQTPRRSGRRLVHDGSRKTGGPCHRGDRARGGPVAAVAYVRR